MSNIRHKCFTASVGWRLVLQGISCLSFLIFTHLVTHATGSPADNIDAGNRKSSPWHFSISLDAGQNSNIAPLDDDTLSVKDVSGESAFFGSLGFGTSYEYHPSRLSSIVGSYNVSASFYNDMPDFKELTHVLSADYKRSSEDGSMMGAMKIGYESYMIGGDSFRNRFVMRPATAYRLADWTVIEGTYSFLLDSYGISTSVDEQNRDGSTHIISLAEYFYPPNTKFELKVGVLYSSVSTEGSDFEARVNGLVVGLSHPLPMEITGGLEYTRTSSRAAQVNSLPDAGGNSVKASMDTDNVGICLQRRLGKLATVRLNYGIAQRDSNIPLYNYNQQVMSTGLTFNF